MECSLLQNAVESQEHLVHIRHWEQKCHSMSLVTPLDLSTASEISSDQEELIRPPQLPGGTNPLSANKPSTIKVVFETDATEDTADPLQVSKDTWENLPSEQSLAPGDHTVIRSQLPNPAHVSPAIDTTLESDHVITPDSGTYTEVPSELPMEPPAVTSSHDELASLEACKQQLAAQQQSLRLRHEACTARMVSIKEVCFLPCRPCCQEVVKSSNIQTPYKNCP